MDPITSGESALSIFGKVLLGKMAPGGKFLFIPSCESLKTLPFQCPVGKVFLGP